LIHNKVTLEVLELIKAQYRDQIAMQLIQEEEEHIQLKVEVRKGKKKEVEENIKVEVEVYDEKYWLPYPFYKYFFDDESIAECLVLLSKENFEKTPQKKKKAKKIASTPKEQIENISKESNVVKEPVKKVIKAEVKVVKKEVPIVNKVVKSKKKKRKSKAARLEDKKALEEYEELKQKTFKLFGKLINTSIPTKKHNKSKRTPKHNIKAKKSEEVEESNDCLSSQCGTTASHISEFIPSDNNEEECEEKILAPYVGTYFEIEFFTSLNTEIELFTQTLIEHNKKLKKYAEYMQQAMLTLVQSLFAGMQLNKE
jgi:hypothetical protein